MGNVVGIDLGTTNTVAAFKFAQVEIVTGDSNAPPHRKLTRSAVAACKETILVGEAAYQQLSRDPENTVVSIKRLMGRGLNDLEVQEHLTRFGYKITQAEYGTENSLVVWMGGRAYEPEDISAEILKQVVKNAQAFQAVQGRTREITNAVITIPAYFNDKQRHATRTAAFRAGLNPLELLPEPTAAAISYGFKADGTGDVKTILVYDFGGGTFDASVITIAGNQFIELGKAGDLWLGGDDIDHAIIDFVKHQVSQEEGLEDIDALIAQMPHHSRIRFQADLKRAAEQAKTDLSRVEKVQIVPSSPLKDEMGLMIPINVELTRQTFEQLISPIIDRTIQVCQDAISYSEYTPDLIDAVLLVGGSSQIPLVRKKVQAAFGVSKVVVHSSPMYAVAEGAAIVAAGLTEKVGTVSRDYFIELVDTPRFKLINRGDILPIQTSYSFKTIADGQRLIHFKFFNRDDERQKDEPVGQMWLGLDQYYPKGTEVFVTMELDERIGDLCITAVLKNNPTVRISSSFSRGKADERIYEELIQVIEKLNTQKFLPETIEEVSQKIVPIVQVTNKIIDPESGQEHIQFRKQAEQQLTHLKISLSEERNRAEFLIGMFELLLETCDFLIRGDQQNRLRNHCQQLQGALSKNDLLTLQTRTEQAQQEARELPEVVQFIHICHLAVLRASTQNSTDANVMDSLLGRMLVAMKNEEVHEVERLWRNLQPKVSHWMDEQLPTANIVTGISR